MPKVISLISSDIASEFRVVPMEIDRDKNLALAMIDPSDTHAVDEIGFFTGLSVFRVVAPPTAIAWALQRYYGIASPLVEPVPIDVKPKKKQAAVIVEEAAEEEGRHRRLGLRRGHAVLGADPVRSHRAGEPRRRAAARGRRPAGAARARAAARATDGACAAATRRRRARARSRRRARPRASPRSTLPAIVIAVAGALVGHLGKLCRRAAFFVASRRASSPAGLGGGLGIYADALRPAVLSLDAPSSCSGRRRADTPALPAARSPTRRPATS